MLRFCCDRPSGSALPARDEVQPPASPYRRYPDGAHRAAPASECATGRHRGHECGLDRRDVEGAQRSPAGAQDSSFALVVQPGRVGAAVGRSSRFHRRHGAQFTTPGRAKPVCHQRSNGAPGDGRAPLGGGGCGLPRTAELLPPGRGLRAFHSNHLGRDGGGRLWSSGRNAGPVLGLFLPSAGKFRGPEAILTGSEPQRRGDDMLECNLRRRVRRRFAPAGAQVTGFQSATAASGRSYLPAARL